jgi:hypothetical protein
VDGTLGAPQSVDLRECLRVEAEDIPITKAEFLAQKPARSV